MLNSSTVSDDAATTTTTTIETEAPKGPSPQQRQRQRRRRSPGKAKDEEERGSTKAFTSVKKANGDGTTTQQRQRRPSTRNARNGRSSPNNHNNQNSNNSRNHKRSSNRPYFKPWRAGYTNSKKTQTKIEEVYRRSFTHNDPKAKLTDCLRILSIVLDETPPFMCNEVNVMYALTCTAKLCPRSTTNSAVSPDERRLRVTVRSQLDRLVFSVLVPEFVNRPDGLTGRQLTNAAWAVVKHDEANGLLSDNGEEGARLLPTLASRLVNVLSNETAVALKPGELCMAAWAYAVRAPRDRPIGWPVKEEEDEEQTKQQLATTESVNGISFETGREFLLTVEEQEKKEKRRTTEEREKEEQTPKPYQAATVEDALFEKISETLLRPLATKESVEQEKRSSGAVDADDNTDAEPPSPLLRLSECNWKELANLAWAYAARGQDRETSPPVTERMILSLAEEATARLRRSNDAGAPRPLPRDVSLVAWSLGVLQVDNYNYADGLIDFVDALVDATVAPFDDENDDDSSTPLARWKCADIVQVALALGHGRVHKPELARAIFTEARLSIDRFRSHELSVLLWVQAKLYLTDDDDDDDAKQRPGTYRRFASAAARTLLGRLSHEDDDAVAAELGAQERANLAWSLVVLERHRDDDDAAALLERVFALSYSCDRDDSVRPEHEHQLWQALFVLEFDRPAVVADVPPALRESLRASWRAEKARRKRSSHRHRALSRTLDAMGVAHRNEHDEDIDVAIVLRSPEDRWTGRATTCADDESATRVAVEFDGPTHFTRPRRGRARPDGPLGHTVLKYRMLKMRGWTVVRVPYYEFDKIPFWASMERQRYLQRALKTHADLRFSDADISEYTPQVPNRRSRYD